MEKGAARAVLIDHLLTSVKGVFAEDAAHAFSHVILADPQAHIDALVEAGVLESVPGNTQYRYRVVQPHKHDLAITWTEDDLVGLGCRTCSHSLQVPNRLPIEVPE